MSYNQLYFDELSEDSLPSDDFIDNLNEFLCNSERLVHLDISGMKLGRDYNPEQYSFEVEVEGHTSNAPILSLIMALS